MARTGLRERDHLAKRLRTGKKHAGAIPANRDAAVRRRAELERVEEEAKLLLRLLLGHAEHREHALLDITLVNTDRAATDLIAIAHDVVGPGKRLPRRFLEPVAPLLVRRGERMVDRRPALRSILRLGLLEHRGIDDPQEGPRALVNELEPAGHLDSSRTKERAGIRCLARGEEDAVARLGADRCDEAIALLVAQVLGDRTTECAIGIDRYVGKALGTPLLRPLLPRIELATRLIAATRHHDRTHVLRLEHPERGGRKVRGEVDELKAEPQIWLVAAESSHCLGVCHLRDVADLDVEDALPKGADNLLAHLGVAVERFAYRPLRNSSRLAPLISALGVSLFLQNAALLLFGARVRLYDTGQFIDLRSGISIGRIRIDPTEMMVVIGALLLMAGLWLMVNRTRLGRAMRAVAVDQDAAVMNGINVDRTVVWTFAIASGLAGAAGVMSGLLLFPGDQYMGVFAGLKGFSAAVLGGIGSIPGAMLGGFLLGITEALVTGYLNPTYADFIAFLILILVLLIRPRGILGRPAIAKV